MSRGLSFLRIRTFARKTQVCRQRRQLASAFFTGRGQSMRNIRGFLTPATWLATAGLLTATAFADDMVSFASGGYASGLRTMEMMHMIDSNKDGMVSKYEWVAYQERVFKALDKDGDGSLDTEEFYGHPMPISFATAGYSHGLETKQMFGKLDAN